MSIVTTSADTLVTRINEAHRKAVLAAGAAVEFAIEAGQLLIEAKSQCQHGDWQNWVAENFEGSTRTAQVYMRVAREYGTLPKAQRDAHLPLRQIVELIADRDDLRTESVSLAGVTEETYEAGKRVLDAVATGKLDPGVIDSIRSGETTIEHVARLVGVPPEMVLDAKAIKDADPALADEVRKGNISIHAAKKKLDPPPDSDDTPMSLEDRVLARLSNGEWLERLELSDEILPHVPKKDARQCHAVEGEGRWIVFGNAVAALQKQGKIEDRIVGDDYEYRLVPDADPPSVDYGKCPNCAGTKWTRDDSGLACAKCNHPHGEATGGADDDRIGIQRSKTVKTVEALMRAFDDLNLLLPKPEHGEAIRSCKSLLQTARAWK